MECPDGGNAIECRECREQMGFVRELVERFRYWLKYGGAK